MIPFTNYHVREKIKNGNSYTGVSSKNQLTFSQRNDFASPAMSIAGFYIFYKIYLSNKLHAKHSVMPWLKYNKQFLHKNQSCPALP